VTSRAARGLLGPGYEARSAGHRAASARLRVEALGKGEMGGNCGGEEYFRGV
jgi:hypothetical protein